MLALLASGALLAGAYGTGWLYWLVVLYGCFLLTSILLSRTKIGAALLAFAAEPKPTTAAGWLDLGVPPPLPAIAAAPAPAAAAAPALPETGKEKRRRRRKRA